MRGEGRGVRDQVGGVRCQEREVRGQEIAGFVSFSS